MVTSVHVLVYSREGVRVFEGRGGIDFIGEIDMANYDRNSTLEMPRARRSVRGPRCAARGHRDRVPPYLAAPR
jgi:hypothetical protein